MSRDKSQVMNQQRGPVMAQERQTFAGRFAGTIAAVAIAVTIGCAGLASAATSGEAGAWKPHLERRDEARKGSEREPTRVVILERHDEDGSGQMRMLIGGPWGMWLWHPQTHREDRGDRSESQRGDRRPRELPWDREPTSEEWGQTVEFLRDHSPRRLEMYQQLEERLIERAAEEREEAGVDGDEVDELPRPVRALRLRMHLRVQGMEELREENPAIYAFAVEQFALEDEIVAALYDARAARSRGETAREVEAHTYATAAIRQYLDNVLQERESRIEELRAELEREESRLARDRERADELIQRLRQRFERFLPPVESQSGRRGRADTEVEPLR